MTRKRDPGAQDDSSGFTSRRTACGSVAAFAARPQRATRQQLLRCGWLGSLSVRGRAAQAPERQHGGINAVIHPAIRRSTGIYGASPSWTIGRNWAIYP